MLVLTSARATSAQSTQSTQSTSSTSICPAPWLWSGCSLPPLPRMLDLVHSQNGLLLVYSLFIDYLLPPFPNFTECPTLCSPCVHAYWFKNGQDTYYTYCICISCISFACSQSCFWACFWACARPCALPKRLLIACWLLVYCLFIGCSLPLTRVWF